MVISSAGYRHLASRAPATIQAGRAQYLTAQEAAAAAAVKEPVQVFAQQAQQAFAASAPTGMIDLDTSSNAGGDAPATTGNLLARYLVIREGEEFEFSAQATSVLFYVIRGSGRSFQESEVIEWSAGDVFVFPGGESILNEAPQGDAVLFVITDEPFVSMTGCRVPPREDARCKSTHFTVKAIQARLEDMVEQHNRELAAAEEKVLRVDAAARDDAAQGENAAQHSEAGDPGSVAAKVDEPALQQASAEADILVFASSQFEDIGCVAPTFSAAIEMLVGGAHTQPHCHDAETIYLPLKGEAAHITLGPERVDCQRNTAILMPSGAGYALHNGGEGRFFSFFIQDRGPRPVRTRQSDADDRTA